MSLDLWNNIKKNIIKPIYLLYGTENFLIDVTKDLLINKVLKEDELDFNLSVYDLEETPIEAVMEDAETFPFFGEKRIVIIKNPTFLTSEKDKIEHNTKKLEEYLENPAPYSTIVFIAPYDKLDERKRVTKIIKKHAEILEAKPLTEKEIVQWIQQQTKKNNVAISPDAIELLLQLTSQNLMLIASEIDKLSLYVGEKGMIEKDTVQLLVARTVEQNIFELIDQVVHRNLPSALRIFYDLLQNNEEPIKILSLLAAQFRLILQAKYLASQGYGQKQIAAHAKVHPYRVKLALGQAELFSLEELNRIMMELAEADFKMKNGKMEKALILELFLLQLK